ncbi:MAG: DUF4313 domain-containing protein [Blautia faecis]
MQRRTHFESGFLSLQKQAFYRNDQEKDREEELYDILTVSLPAENIKINEAFISDFECKYKLSFIRKYKLGEVLQRVEHSGFCDYRLVRFDLEKLAEYDREGVKKFLAEQEGGHA